MNKNTLCAVALALLSVAFDTAVAQQPAAVLQRGYDPGLSGANLTETTLTPANVTPATFGLVFKLPVDDRIYAQPLYVPNVPMLQGTHNVVYVATMSDTLYAFDADVGGQPLWSVNFASSVGAVPVAFANFTFGGNTNIVGNLGILSTPIIDLPANIMYLVAGTLEGGTLVYRLHAVNITNGTEPYTNVVISGAYEGVPFIPAHQTQRASLALAGDQVVFGFGAVEAETDDEGGYTGWVMAYNKQTLVQSGIFASVTTGSTLGGGVWQSGRPPVVDGSGFVYVFTGNGYQNGYNGTTNFSESALKLDPDDGLALVDWFTPSNWSTMDQQDADLASSGPLLIPNTTPSLIAGGGKTGILYLLNTTDLGQYTPTDSGVVQKQSISSASMRGGPVYWQRTSANGGPMLYNWADVAKAYAFNGATFGTSPSSQGTVSQVYPGGILALSANGGQQGTGVLWATVAASGNVYNDGTDPGVLYALDAGNLTTPLWTSTTNSARDNYGSFAKFVPPLVANGKVYVATFSGQVAVYGLLPVAATPTFTPAPGTYTSTQTVTLSDATSGASIYYTTNGTTPTTSSSQYVPGTPLSISATTTIEAIAAENGYINSAVAVGTYTITVATTPVSVSLTTADNVVGIGNTGTAVSGGGLDGYGNVYAGNLLGTSISWFGSTFALGSADLADAVSSTTIALPAGSYSGLNLLATGVDGNQPNQTFVVTYTDGTTTSIVQSLSDWYTPQHYAGESIAFTTADRVTSSGGADNRTFYVYGYSFAINSAKTVQSITLPTNNHVVVLALDLVPAGGSSQAVTATPTFTPAPGPYTGTQQVTLSDATPGTLIYYTTNGTTPTTASSQFVAGTPLSVSATTTVTAMAALSGYANSAVAVGTYTISAPPPAAMPTFSLAPGAYAGTQQVTLSDATSGASIYYTTNGTTPTTSSSRFVQGTPLSISATTTIEAMAVESGYTNSAVASGTYTISALPNAATPTFTPAQGLYTGTQQVTLSDATSGAIIYYTTNGSTPTTSSSQFVPGSPLSISATTTIKAIAVESGYTNSALAVGTYTIAASATTPVSVSLTMSADVIGMGNAGTAVGSGGLDGGGTAYAANLLGTSITWSGSTFALGSPDLADAVSSATLALPASNYASVNLLATGVNGNQINQSFVVTYTDGTTTSIVQSLSDWYTPQNYAGESIAATTAYRITSSGGTDNRTFNLYGYSFALNSAKTVQSITLPNNRNVVVLALDLVPVGGSSQAVAATPTFSPVPGTYAGMQSVTLSDTTPGTVIYYTTDGTMPTPASTAYAGGSLSISATTTIEAIAVASGYTNSAVEAGTYTISDGAAAVSVSLTAADDVVGIGNAGTAVSGGGLDGNGNVYAANLLGTSVTWSGAVFALGSAGVADALNSATIALPAGSYSSVNLLATGVDGNQPNQSFVVTYTDGTTTSIVQSLSDWYTPQNYAGESIAATTAYRVTPSGGIDNRTFNLYGYSLAINSAKTVQSITLPSNPHVEVLSIDLVP